MSFAQACARRVVEAGLLIRVAAASQGVVGALMPARRGIAPRGAFRRRSWLIPGRATFDFCLR